MKINYTRIGDYGLPNLKLRKQTERKINKYGLLRLNYLKQNNKALYTTLLMKDELNNHLVSVSIESEKRLNILMNVTKIWIKNYPKSIKKNIN